MEGCSLVGRNGGFSLRDTHDAKLGNFKGYAVGLTARNSDVMCDSVMATFGKWPHAQIFRWLSCAR